MANYKVEYKDIEGNDYRVEIYLIDRYATPLIPVRGYANITVPKPNDILHVLRGTGLSLTLEANKDLTFEDLYTEKETDRRVDLFRNGYLLFRGFVKPDGLYTDFVNERWEITLDCIDGLGVLENLSFVDPDGMPYIGFHKEIKIIHNSLRRTTLNLPINTDVEIFHDGMTDDYMDKDVFDETKLLTDRFYKDKENSDIMDCAQIIRSILEKYNAVIQQKNGEWYIYRPIDIPLNEKRKFFKYVNGNLDSTFEENLKLTVGSHINGFDLFHVNENQRLEINGSVSKFRVKYEYGYAQRLLNNPYLESDSNDNILGWTKGNDLSEPRDEGGRIWDVPDNWFDIPQPSEYQFKLENPISVKEGDGIVINYDYFAKGFLIDLGIEIELNSASGKKYFRNDGEWHDDASYKPDNRFRIENSYAVDVEPGQGDPREWDQFMYLGDGSRVGKINIPIPEDGDVEVKIYMPIKTDVQKVDNFEYYYQGQSYAYLRKFDVIPDEEAELLELGEFHTVEAVPANSSNVKDVKTVYNGDMTSDLYEGVIKNSDNENTQYWGRKKRGIITRRYRDKPNESIPADQNKILELMVKETIRIQSKPQKVFFGDVYGFFSPIKHVSIDGIKGDFIITGYSFDTKRNIVSLELNEVFQGKISGRDTSIKYDYKIDRGKTVKPAIDG